MLLSSAAACAQRCASACHAILQHVQPQSSLHAPSTKSATQLQRQVKTSDQYLLCESLWQLVRVLNK